MINTNRMPPQALCVLVPVLASVKEPLDTMSPREVLERWLHYEGIIGYTDAIIYMLDALRAAEITVRTSPKA